MSGLGSAETAADAAVGRGPGITWWLFIEQIKAYRQRAKLSHADMMSVGLGSQARWNRLENHKPGVKIRSGDVLVMARAFRLSATEAEELEDMRARAEREIDAGIPDVEPTFREYLAFECHATQVDSLGGVHGLIQTPQYTAAAALLDNVAESEIPGIVALRQERQRRTLGRALLQVALDEEALARRVGSVSVMDELKKHLLELAADGLADISVYPESLGAHSAFRSSATILRFEVGGPRRAVVYTETLIGGSHTDRPELVAGVESKFAMVFERSIPIKEYL